MTSKEAIQLATDTVKGLFSGTEHRLEEVEFRDDSGFDITVSYRTADGRNLVPLGDNGLLSSVYSRRAAIGIDPSRVYKDVSISADGTVRSVRMRQIIVG